MKKFAILDINNNVMNTIEAESQADAENITGNPCIECPEGQEDVILKFWTGFDFVSRI